jgi:hypothetical protein
LSYVKDSSAQREVYTQHAIRTDAFVSGERNLVQLTGRWTERLLPIAVFVLLSVASLSHAAPDKEGLRLAPLSPATALIGLPDGDVDEPGRFDEKSLANGTSITPASPSIQFVASARPVSLLARDYPALQARAPPRF